MKRICQRQRGEISKKKKRSLKMKFQHWKLLKTLRKYLSNWRGEQQRQQSASPRHCLSLSHEFYARKMAPKSLSFFFTAGFFSIQCENEMVKMNCVFVLSNSWRSLGSDGEGVHFFCFQCKSCLEGTNWCRSITNIKRAWDNANAFWHMMNCLKCFEVWYAKHKWNS